VTAPRSLALLAFALVALTLPARALGDSRTSEDTARGVAEFDPSPYRVPAPHLPAKPGSPKAKAKARYLLVVSIDGLAYPTLQRLLPRLPTLRRLAKRGFRRPLITVFPSMTWSSHVSAMTGQYPRVHGILGNRWYQSGKGLVRPYLGQTSDRDRQARTPSLYDLVAAKERSVAALNWSATQHSRTITYNLPETMASRSLPGQLVSPQLAKLIPELRPVRRIGRSQRGRRLGRRWRRRFGALIKREDLRTDRLVNDMALRLLRLPKAKIPQLMLVHYVAADSIQHLRGMRSPRLFPTVRALDRMVAELLRGYRRAGLSRQLAVLVMSDHGFSEIHRTMDLRMLLKREGIARYRSYRDAGRLAAERVYTVYNGHAAFVYVKNDDPKTTALITKLARAKAYRRCVKAVFGPEQYASLGLPRPLDLAPEARKRAAARQRGSYYHPGAPSLIVLSRPDCSFYNGHRRKIVRRTRWRFGVHGYLPTLRSIQAMLIGAGAGIRGGGRELPAARIVDVAPTGARLLGLRWPSTWPGSKERFRLDGRVLGDAL
jgi:predicted AlkP superfamily pyrophosphatase or phosphodiesterase